MPGGSVRAPYPYDVRLNGKGFMVAHNPRYKHALLYSEHSPADQEVGAAGEEILELQAFARGMGLRAYTADPATRGMVYVAWSSLADGVAGPGGDTLGGGFDGSYGVGLPGPFLTKNQMYAGNPVRSLVQFTDSTGATAYYAGIGNKIIKSATADFTSGTGAVQTLATGCSVRQLLAFRGSNSIQRLYALVENGVAMSSADGAAWTNLASVQTDATGVLKWASGGPSLTDYTNVLGTGMVGTMPMSSFGLVAANYLLVGYLQPFNGLTWVLTNANNSGAAGTMVIEYWGTSGWTAVTGLSDGTSSGGKPLNHGTSVDGTTSWTRPAATWVKAALLDVDTTTGATAQTSMYWVRVSFTAALDASVDVETLRPFHNQEGIAGVVDGPTLRILGPDHETIYSTTDGGASPTWTSNIDRLGQPDGEAFGMLAQNNTVYVYRNAGISAPASDGTVEQLLPGLFKNQASIPTPAAFAGWDQRNALYFARGASLLELNTLTNELTEMGPARTLVGDSDAHLQPRVTAAAADDHFLYAAWYDEAAGWGYLAKWGGYVLGQDAGGNPAWGHIDAWHQIGDLGASRKVYSMAVWSASGQPYLAMGDQDGNVLACKLPKANNPLSASSGYLYSTRTAAVFLPTWYGETPVRPVVLTGITIQGRNLTASRTAVLTTKQQDGGSFTTQATVTAAAGDTTTLLSSPSAQWGADARLLLAMTSDNTTPWVLRRILLHYTQPLRTSHVGVDVTLVVGDHTRARDGRVIPKNNSDWLAQLQTITDLTVPWEFVQPNGDARTVLAHGTARRVLALDADGRPTEAVSLTLATTGGV